MPVWNCFFIELELPMVDLKRLACRFAGGLLLAVFCCAPVGAATLAEKVREHTLENGLKLLVVERHGSPTFSAYITIGVGSVDETDKTRGVAHLLEHMLFKGTKRLGTKDFAAEKPLLDEIAAVGAQIDELKVMPDADAEELAMLRQRLAELQEQHKQYVVKDEFSRIYGENGGVGYNAFTSKDLTSYLISLPSNKLELWAAVEADRMQNAVLREFYTEREVIREERRRSYDTRPSGKLYETLIANAFTAHPYRNPIIGWDSDIDNLTLEETQDFLQRYYAPINTVIALVGDVMFEQAVQVVENAFGGISPGTKVPPVAVVEPEPAGEKRVEVEFDAEPQVSIAFHKPTLPERDDYVFDLIDQILTGGRSSRLYRSLVLEQQLATSISTYGAPGGRYPNLFVINAVPRHPHTASEVEVAIETELAKLGEEGVTDEELTRAVNRLRTDHLRQMRTNSGLARSLTYFQTVAGDWRYLAEYDQVMESITIDEIRDTVRRYLVDGKRTVAVLTREEM